MHPFLTKNDEANNKNNIHATRDYNALTYRIKVLNFHILCDFVSFNYFSTFTLQSKIVVYAACIRTI
jgi:hypothetical protein